jgi:CRISPR-associated protein Csd2
MSNELRNRYDFVYMFDVKDGNPNGDPDAGNLPRIDAETGHGLVTDVCLKRKVRNFIEFVRKENIDKEHFDIYIKERAILNEKNEEAHKAVEDAKELEEPNNKRKKNEAKVVEEARKWMCRKYYDVRTFGAVMSTGVNCGQVKGPVQLTFGRSVDPILTLEHSITRMAVTTKAESEKQSGGNRTIGRKNTIPYGLYISYGFISANLANQTGFDSEDLELFWEALINMFEHDRSAARGFMSARKLYVFEHDSSIGNIPAYKLFDLIEIKRKDTNLPVRNFSDYEITIKEENKKEEVRLIEKI